MDARSPTSVVTTCPDDSCISDFLAEAREPSGSTRPFSNFIGFMSNPLQNIDPRSLTQVVPIFGSAWIRNDTILPNLDAQIYGPAISVALTERFCVGANQGGYAFINIDRIQGPRGREFGGTREGWVNLGGFAQYTLIQDVENQFVATAGVRLIVPSGSYEIFQGRGPTQMAPYLTLGKELGNTHCLMTSGFQFPLQSGNRELEIFYLNAHIDHEFFGWVYPLVEVNWTQHTTTVGIDLQTRRGVINFGNFENTGNVVTIAGGVNLVLIRDRLEIGGCYVKAVSTQRNVDIDSMIVKMVLRY
jgi:hypothetical protein